MAIMSRRLYVPVDALTVDETRYFGIVVVLRIYYLVEV